MNVLTLLLPMFLAFTPDLASVKAESNPEHRSDKALEFANQEIDAARDAYSAGDVQKAVTAVKGIGEAVDVSYNALNTGVKNPRRHPKYWKRAEEGVRELLRRLDGLSSDFSVEDRPAVTQVQQHLQDIHDELIAGIMGKKK